MEGAEHLDLIAAADRPQAVVGEHRPEVGTRLQIGKIHASLGSHLTPTRQKLRLIAEYIF